MFRITVGLLAFGFFSPDMLPAASDDFYSLSTLPVPDSISLETGGMTVLPDGRLAVATRHGEIWLIENPTMEAGAPPRFHRFAQGLQEPLGLAYADGSFYAAQRGELTRLTDLDGDDRADAYESVVHWPMSGNHHAYSYGPEILPNGRLWLTFNLDSPEGGMTRDSSRVKWRGWTVLVSPEGSLTPFATGLKAPAGFGLNAQGDMFISENDGRWIGSGWISHVEKGDFLGHPAGLRWKDEPESPIRMKEGPHDIPGDGRPMYQVATNIPAFKLPAVWFPDGIMGTATLDILADTTAGKFGPFEHQLFVGDQGQNRLFRVALEKVKGEYQGVVFGFRDGLGAGLFRQVWANDGSMLLGFTDRGWPSTGDKVRLQRLQWSGNVPFEIKAVRAKPDGFELTFTKPVTADSAGVPGVYQIQSFTYRYHETYGSPTVHHQPCPVRGVKLSPDRLQVRLAVDNLRPYYIHEIHTTGVQSKDRESLLHPVGYYTLNQIPEGRPLKPEEMILASKNRSAVEPIARKPIENLPRPRTKTSPTQMPSAWSGQPDVAITIGTQPGIRYDTPSFTVPRGSRVQLTFENQDDLLHNMVFVKPGAKRDVAQMALDLGLKAYSQGYIPDTAKVLFNTDLVQPGESQTIYFVAPSQPASYPYLCTLPGHWQTMQGRMIVTQP